MTTFTIEEIRARSYKPRDAWWTVLLVDPLAARLVQLAVRYPWITPNRLTFMAFILGLGSAACFAAADYPWLIAGGLLFHLSFVVDCMDGKVARLRGNGSVFGVWLDFIFDQIRVIACTAALFGGQYAVTRNPVYLVAASGVLAVDMLRYLNAWQLGKVKKEMRRRLAQFTEGSPAFLEEAVQQLPLDDDEVVSRTETQNGNEREVVDISADFREKFSLYVRIRNYLIQHRIRTHLVSGIEFQMGVFIIAPLTGAVLVVSAISGGLLLAFEVLLVYKMFLVTRSFERKLAKFETAAVSAEAGDPLRPADQQTLTPQVT